MMKQSSLVVLFFGASIRGGKGGVSSVVGAFTEEGFSAERRRNECPALFSGKDCAEVKTNLPECVDGAFSGKWISLHRNVVRFPRDGGQREDEDVNDDATNAHREDYWRVPRDISEENASLLPEFDIFGMMGNRGNDEYSSNAAAAKSCALVSSAASMSGSNLGAEIDANEIVVRFNNAPTRGYEADVGKKTSFRLTNAIFQGYRENEKEAVLAKWCQDKTSRVPCGKREELTSLIEKKAHAVNPRFFEYANSRYFRKLGEHPTSGMVMTLLLLHRCEKVTLYGFNGKGLKSWYYPKRRKGENAPKKKEWLREKRWTVEGDWIYAKSSSVDGMEDDPLNREREDLLKENAEESTGGRRRRRQGKRRRFSRSASSSSSSSWNLLSSRVQRRGLLLANTDNRTSALPLHPPGLFHSSSSRSSSSNSRSSSSSNNGEEKEIEEGRKKNGAKDEANVERGGTTTTTTPPKQQQRRRSLLHAVKAERACVRQLQLLGFLEEVDA
ncbi:unnamed protein product [Bathycoccus prasinos]